MHQKLLLALTTIFFFVGLNAQKLSKQERKIVKNIEQNNPEAISFLEKVVNINSGTLNLAGVEKVGKEFATAFEGLGFESTWIPMPDEMNRAGHLFAEIKGTKGKKLLLIGHLDTVFEEDSPFQTFEMVNDSMAHAPGGNDMKGGDVPSLISLSPLPTAHPEAFQRLSVRSSIVCYHNFNLAMGRSLGFASTPTDSIALSDSLSLRVRY